MKAFCECGHQLKPEIDGRTFALCWKCTPKFKLHDRVRHCTWDGTEYVVVHVDEAQEHYVLRPPGTGLSPLPNKGARVVYAGELAAARSAPGHSAVLEREQGEQRDEQ